MVKRNTRRSRGGFRFSFERGVGEKTLNPLTWFGSNAQVAPLEEVVVNNQKPTPAPPSPIPNTVINVAPPAPNAIRVIGEANAAGIPPTPAPGLEKVKIEGGRRRKRTARKAKSRRSARKSSRSAKRSARKSSRSAKRSARRKH